MSGWSGRGRCAPRPRRGPPCPRRGGARRGRYCGGASASVPSWPVQPRLVARLPGRLLMVARVAEVVPLLRPLLAPGRGCRVPHEQVALAREDDHLVPAISVDVADGGVGDVPAAGELGPAGRLDPVRVERMQVVA